MKVYRLTPEIGLIDLAPPIPGMEKMFSAYVLKAQKIALIDPGPTSCLSNLFAGLDELGVKPADISYILATHIHLDHTGGAGAAIKQMPQAKIIVHEKGRPHLADPARLWESSRKVSGEMLDMYGRPEPVPESRMITAWDGMKIDLGGMELEVWLTPGHASHHLCFIDRKRGNLFAGEAAGVYFSDIGMVRPATPPPFNLEQALASLDRLISLKPGTLCYAHFGCVTDAIAKLHSCKEQLILWGSVIADNLENRDWQYLYQKIRDRDKTLERPEDVVGANSIRQLYFVQNNILGYLDYFEKNGTDFIKRLRD